MRFTSILATAGFALLASAAGTATSAAPATSVDAATAAANSAQAEIQRCLGACKDGDVNCSSKCIAVPNPNEAQVRYSPSLPPFLPSSPLPSSLLPPQIPADMLWHRSTPQPRASPPAPRATAPRPRRPSTRPACRAASAPTTTWPRRARPSPRVPRRAATATRAATTTTLGTTTATAVRALPGLAAPSPLGLPLGLRPSRRRLGLLPGWELVVGWPGWWGWWLLFGRFKGWELFRGMKGVDGRWGVGLGGLMDLLIGLEWDGWMDGGACPGEATHGCNLEERGSYSVIGQSVIVTGQMII